MPPHVRRFPHCEENKTRPGAFFVPGGTVISVIAILLSIWLLSNSTLTEARDSAIGAVVGLIIYIVIKGRKSRAGTPLRDFVQGASRGR